MDQNSVDNQNNPDKMRALHFSSLVFLAKHFFKSAPGIISLVVIFVMLWLGVATVFSRLSIKGKTTPMLASSEKVKSLIENEVTNYRVSVNFPGGKIKQYKLEDLGITLNVDKTVAASRKKQKNIKSRIVWWQAQEVDLQYDVNKDKLRSFITKEIDKID